MSKRAKATDGEYPSNCTPSHVGKFEPINVVQYGWMEHDVTNGYVCYLAICHPVMMGGTVLSETDCIRGDNAVIYQWIFFYGPLCLLCVFCV